MALPAQAAVDFDGTDDYIDCGDSNELSFGDGSTDSPFSLSAWVKADIFTGNSRGIIGKATDSNVGEYYLLFNTSGRLYLRLVDDSTSAYIGRRTAGSLSTSTWYHTVATYNGNGSDSGITIYVDGSSQSLVVDSTGTYTAMENTSDSFRIGRRRGADSFDGLIDDVRIYDRELTATEIETLYKSRSKRIGGSLANGLVAHYEMDDDAIGRVVAQAEDSSGNAVHGSYENFTSLPSALSSDVPANGTGMMSIEWDGSSDYITLSSALDQAGDFSVAVWVKPDDLTGRVIIGDSSNDYIRLTTANQVVTRFSGSNTYISHGLTFTTGEWQHFMAIRNGSTTTIYRNNTASGTTGSDASTFNVNQLGVYGTTPFSFYDGLMTDVRLYSDALTSGERDYVFSGGKSGSDPGTANLAGHWKLDNSAVKDSSGNNNHGIGSGGDSLQYTGGILRR